MRVKDIVQLGVELLPRPYAIELARYMAKANPDEEIDDRGMKAIATHMVGEYGSQENLEPSLETLEELTDLLEPYQDEVPEEVADAVKWVLYGLADAFGQRDAIRKLVGSIFGPLVDAGRAQVVEVVVPGRAIAQLLAESLGLAMTDVPDDDEEDEEDEEAIREALSERARRLREVLRHIVGGRDSVENASGIPAAEALERLMVKRAEEGDKCSKCEDRHGCLEIGLAVKCPTCGQVHKAGLPCINPECSA